MTERLPCPPSPGLLEGFAARSNDLFKMLAQRRGFRQYLQSLLLPRDRHKTVTAIASAELVVGARVRHVQQVQFLPFESTRHAMTAGMRPLDVVCAEPATTLHEQGCP